MYGPLLLPEISEKSIICSNKNTRNSFALGSKLELLSFGVLTFSTQFSVSERNNFPCITLDCKLKKINKNIGHALQLSEYNLHQNSVIYLVPSYNLLVR